MRNSMRIGLGVLMLLATILPIPLPAFAWQITLVSVGGRVEAWSPMGASSGPLDLVAGEVVSTVSEFNADYGLEGEARSSLSCDGSTCTFDASARGQGLYTWYKRQGVGALSSVSGVRLVLRIDRQPGDQLVTSIIVDWNSECWRACATPGCNVDETFSHVQGGLAFDGLQAIDMATSWDGQTLAGGQWVEENVADGALIVFANGLDPAGIVASGFIENDQNEARATAALHFQVMLPSVVDKGDETWGRVKSLYR